MTAATATATCVVAPACPEPALPAATVDDPGFAAHIATALSTNADASAVGGGAEAPPPPVRRPRHEEPPQAEAAEALVLLSLMQPWLNTAPSAPAPTPAATTTPPSAAMSLAEPAVAADQPASSPTGPAPTVLGLPPSRSATPPESTALRNPARPPAARLHLATPADPVEEQGSVPLPPSSLQSPPNHAATPQEKPAATSGSKREVPNPRATETCSTSRAAVLVSEAPRPQAKPAASLPPQAMVTSQGEPERTPHSAGGPITLARSELPVAEDSSPGHEPRTSSPVTVPPRLTGESLRFAGDLPAPRAPAPVPPAEPAGARVLVEPASASRVRIETAIGERTTSAPPAGLVTTLRGEGKPPADSAIAASPAPGNEWFYDRPSVWHAERTQPEEAGAPQQLPKPPATAPDEVAGTPGRLASEANPRPVQTIGERMDPASTPSLVAPLGAGSGLPADPGVAPHPAPGSEPFLGESRSLRTERTQPERVAAGLPASERVVPATPGTPAGPVSQRLASSADVRIERTPAPSLAAPLHPSGSAYAAEASPALSTVTASSAGGAVDAPPEAQAAPVPARWLGSAAETRFTEVKRSAAPAFRNWSGPAAGTGDAELSDGMQNATQPKQFAGLAQQNLPEPGAAMPPAAPELWRRGEPRPVRAAGEVDTRAEATTSWMSLMPPEPAGLRPLEEPLAPLARANASVPADPLSASVLRQVTELRQTGAAEMSVVLRPDAETQISLRLSLGGSGEVLVQARCEEGDAQALAANWGEIRHSLAQQGVRLGALEFSPGRSHDTFQPHAGSGGPSPDGQPSSHRHGSPWRETLDDLSLPGSFSGSAALRAGQRPPAGRTRLLESWA